jgi:CubicO group peptidase (beta-lactamase class C family)
MGSLSIQIDDFVERVREHWSIPGVTVAAVRRTGPVHVRGYGVRSVANAIPTDSDSTFAIGSCSKAFTTALMAALVDGGKLGWDDLIRKYLPDFRLADPWVSDHVTFRDMLAHRTGLSRASLGEYGSDLSRADVLRQARHIQHICEFRDQFAYCNIGYVSAAEAMAASAGQPFERLMEQHILAPLDLTAGTVADDFRNGSHNIAAPHYRIDGAIREIPPIELDNLVGAVGQTMSARQAATWLAFHLADGAPEGARLISSNQLRETHLLQIARRDRSLFDGHGLGWDVRNRFIHHEGAVRGFRAVIWCDLAEGTAAFVAVNLGSGFAHFAIAHYLHQVLRGQTVKDWITHFDDVANDARRERVACFDKERREEPISMSHWAPDDFVGDYRHEGFGKLHIEPKGDHLWFRIDGLSGFDGPLMRYSGLSFEYQGDRDAMAWPTIAVAKTPRGECARVRFRAGATQIEGLDWFDWFGQAHFVRDA